MGLQTSACNYKNTTTLYQWNPFQVRFECIRYVLPNPIPRLSIPPNLMSLVSLGQLLIDLSFFFRCLLYHAAERKPLSPNSMPAARESDYTAFNANEPDPAESDATADAALQPTAQSESNAATMDPPPAPMTVRNNPNLNRMPRHR